MSVRSRSKRRQKCAQRLTTPIVENLEPRLLLAVELFTEINPGAASSYAFNFANIGSTTYFAADDGVHEHLIGALIEILLADRRRVVRQARLALPDNRRHEQHRQQPERGKQDSLDGLLAGRIPACGSGHGAHTLLK